VAAKARPACDKLNRHLILRARGSGDVLHLASPVSGGGFHVNRTELLFLYFQQQGLKTPQDVANAVWAVVKGGGQKLIRDGQTLESEDESQKYLLEQVQNFQQKRLPVLRALQIV